MGEHTGQNGARGNQVALRFPQLEERGNIVMPQSTIGSTATPSPEPGSTQGPRARESYQRLSEEIRSVPDGDLVTINIDVPTAVSTTLALIPRIRELRPAVANLSTFDLSRYDKLEDYAFALAHAHTLYLAASAPARPLDELVAAGTALRQVLAADASALAARGLVNGDTLDEIRGSTGYLDLAFDLSTLAALMRETWSTIASQTGVKLAELDRAEMIAEQVLVAAGMRAQAPAVMTASAQTRQRSFTLFLRAYDEVRRAVSYLRWHEGDADSITPSLYAGRTSRRKPTAAQQPVQQTTAPAATAATVPAAGATPGAVVTAAHGAGGTA
jgi:hypothetical protein